MITVRLPSGHSASLRGEFLRGDRREALRGMKLVYSPDGSRVSEGSVVDEVVGRIIARMLVEWDNGLPLPGNATGEHVQGILDQLPDDDYLALQEAVAPWTERTLTPGGRGTVLTHDATGVQVTAATAEDAARLAASGGFTAAQPAPKAATTATSSPAPAPSGPAPLTAPVPPTSG